jgi:hypothetical protein
MDVNPVHSVIDACKLSASVSFRPEDGTLRSLSLRSDKRRLKI